jgi:hypothetical protein
MKSDWLTFQSFQQSQEVLKAINTLSIHLKLSLKGISDDARLQAVEQAIILLSDFLDKLENIADQANQADTMPLVGLDPKLQQFARNFLSARHQRRFRSRLFAGSISEIKDMLRSTDPNAQKTLVKCLTDLRVLIEEHMHDDVDRILGAI